MQEYGCSPHMSLCVTHHFILTVNRQRSVFLWFFFFFFAHSPRSAPIFLLLQFCIAKCSFPIDQLWVLQSFVYYSWRQNMCINGTNRLWKLWYGKSDKFLSLSNQLVTSKEGGWNDGSRNSRRKSQKNMLRRVYFFIDRKGGQWLNGDVTTTWSGIIFP